MSQTQHEFYVTTPHGRPDFRLVQAFLWGDDKDTDSDGNAINPASRKWTELILELRGAAGERFDVVEHKWSPLTLKVMSENKYLAARVAYLLAHCTRGQVARTSSGPYENSETLIPEMGQDFDLEEALTRFHDSPFRQSTLENPDLGLASE